MPDLSGWDLRGQAIWKQGLAGFDVTTCSKDGSYGMHVLVQEGPGIYLLAQPPNRQMRQVRPRVMRNLERLPIIPPFFL